jgi:nucleoside-diphosphate-sugar epimerase
MAAEKRITGAALVSDETNVSALSGVLIVGEARDVLGFEPRTRLEEGLAAEFAWLQSVITTTSGSMLAG